MPSTVILLTGPIGSGKTTIAARIAESPDWVHISEDLLWDETGHPAQDARDDGGQVRVHALAHRYILQAVKDGKNAVLEFLVYENPPFRITHYQDFLNESDIEVVTRILVPSRETVIARQKSRGRPTERSESWSRNYLEHTMRCLSADMIEAEWLVDSTDQSVEETYGQFFYDIVSAASPARAP